jgi:hypothetical protein
MFVLFALLLTWFSAVRRRVDKIFCDPATSLQKK